ncbi:hypothetical protein BGZ80_006370, partial [Entomortierella chlamydospora]
FNTLQLSSSQISTTAASAVPASAIPASAVTTGKTGADQKDKAIRRASGLNPNLTESINSGISTYTKYCIIIG